jgi:hypothetical protein
MERIECINGLDYDQVIFRKDLVDLVRVEIKTKIDYIKSIDIDKNANEYIINYVIGNKNMAYHVRHGEVAKKIDQFYKIENRNDKLKKLGI